MPGIPAFRRLKQDRTARPHLKRQTVKQQPPAVCGAVITSTWEVRGGGCLKFKVILSYPGSSKSERERRGGRREGGRERPCLKQTEPPPTASTSTLAIWSYSLNHWLPNMKP